MLFPFSCSSAASVNRSKAAIDSLLPLMSCNLKLDPDVLLQALAKAVSVHL